MSTDKIGLCAIFGVIGGALLSVLFGQLNDFPWYIDFVGSSVLICVILILLTSLD